MKVAAMMMVLLASIAVGTIGYFIWVNRYQAETIQTEQASEEIAEETTEEEESSTESEEEDSSETPEVSESSSASHLPGTANPSIEVDPVLASVSVQPSGLTPQQIENRRKLEECRANYTGTGPSCWVQGQMEQAGITPTPPPTSLCHQDRSACTAPNGGRPRTEQEMESYAAQSRAANNGQGEGAN
jgi:hypothetical protein